MATSIATIGKRAELGHAATVEKNGPIEGPFSFSSHPSNGDA
jgi:hypothetical protein